MVVVDEVAMGGAGMEISGHRMSTTEITNVLLSHPDISDAAVVTVPDERKGEVMKAFAKVKEGVVPSNDLKLELAWLVLTELKPIGVFKSIELEQEETQKAPVMGEEVHISGHTLLSIDVEEALVSHPSVAEAIVVGVPDGTHGEALQAFVNLNSDVLPTEALKEELAWHARTEIGPEVVFRSVKFRSFLPRAKDRKTLRSILRADALEIPTKMSITMAD
jgi:acyl-coenzyme A synthetase/AMP-(fatty) acid ligase